jgi:hypothetical protein
MRKTLLILLALSSCTVQPPKQPMPPSAGRCDVVSETLQLANQKLALPATGKVVLESHLATTADSFAGGRAFPQNDSESISEHLARACALLPKGTDCAKAYASKWVKLWTPPESGKAGQGSVGDLKPSPLEEMWSGNMFWTAANKPKPGTRFLAQRGGKSVVVVMGYETGPRDASFIGGLQGEPINYLGSQDGIRLARLKDQSLDPGPLTCP